MASDALVSLVKSSEGLRLRAYRDAVGVLTIGYGHTGPDVVDGMEIDEATALRYLAEDLDHAEEGALRLCPGVTGGLLDALTDFVFNLGYGRLQGSTLRKLVNSAAPLTDVADQFRLWTHAGGHVLPGLVRRRDAEVALFLSPA